MGTRRKRSCNLDDNQDVWSVVNDSGFPLQIAVQRVIEKNKGEFFTWETEVTEHAWKIGEVDGFIDLVVGDGKGNKLIIECKRVQNASWIFLVTAQSDYSRRAFTAWTTHFAPAETSQGVSRPNRFKKLGWSEMPVDPASYRSMYFVTRGQVENKRLMLERIASEVCLATEAIAIEDEKIENNRYKSRSEWATNYFGVIVTTATIQVADVASATIELSNGKVSNVGDNVKEEKWIRFHKQLSTSGKIADSFNRLNDLGQSRERTVFVVGASYIQEFLKQFNSGRT